MKAPGTVYGHYFIRPITFTTSCRHAFRTNHSRCPAPTHVGIVAGNDKRYLSDKITTTCKAVHCTMPTIRQLYTEELTNVNRMNPVATIKFSMRTYKTNIETSETHTEFKPASLRPLSVEPDVQKLR